MKQIIIFIFSLFLLISFSTNVNAQSRRAYKSKSYKPKTVHVRSYTTKKGKHVRAHKRSRPSSKTFNLMQLRELRNVA